MGHYSIKDLEKISGVKAHTIRIWEKRFNIIKPNRTETNFRYYDDVQLKKLLNISLLNNNGHKISSIAKLDDSEICKEVEKISKGENGSDSNLEELVLCMIEMDEEKFEQQLNELISNLGFEVAMLRIVYPFFDKIGMLWQTGNINPAQEHFVSNLIRQKIIVAIDGLVEKTIPNHKTFLLFLPEGEMHEIGLLFCTFLIRRSGHKVIYLGQSLPISDLAYVVRKRKPDLLLTYITSPVEGGIKKYIYEIRKICPTLPLYISGIQSCNIDFADFDNILCLNSSDDIQSLLTSFRK